MPLDDRVACGPGSETALGSVDRRKGPTKPIAFGLAQDRMPFAFLAL
jgi:hypothetical protein